MDKNEFDISILVGQRIKHFRKEKIMTMEDLAMAISKSVSTVSKYESGTISMDIITLLDIAIALEVDIVRLVEHPTKPAISPILGNPFGTSTLYLYHYDGRIKRIVRSMIHIVLDDVKEKICAVFYLNVPRFDEYNRCEYYYKGEVYNSDTMIHFILSNPYNPSVRVAITTVNPYKLNHLSSANITFWGVFLGFSFKPFGPFASKVLFSKTPQQENDELKELLLLSKEDIRSIRSYNLLAPNFE